MKHRILLVTSAVAIACAPLAVLAQWQGAPATPPSSNVSGPVWLQSSSPSPQSGSFSVTGGRFSDDIYQSTTGKALRVDNPGATTFNISNYNGSGTGFTLGVRGNLTLTSFGSTPGILSTPQICLNGDCRTTWPTGSASDIWVDTVGDNMTGALNINKTGAGAALVAVNPEEIGSSIGVQGAGAEWGGHFYITNTTGWDTAIIGDAGRTTGGDVGVWGNGSYAGVEGNGNSYGVLARSYGSGGGYDASFYADASVAGVEFGLYSTGADNIGVFGDGAVAGVQGYGGSYGGHFYGTAYGAYGYTTVNNSTGVQGSTSGSGTNGVHGYATGANSKGVTGVATGANSPGVYGESTGTNPIGVYGNAGNVSNGIGSFGNAGGVNGVGVQGGGGKYGAVFDTYDVNSEDFGVVVGEGPKYGFYTMGTGAETIGGYFRSSQTNGYGVYGQATNGGPSVGVYGTGGWKGVEGYTNNGSGYGGWFVADGANSTGLLTQGATYGMIARVGSGGADRWVGRFENNGFTANGIYVSASGALAASFNGGDVQISTGDSLSWVGGANNGSAADPNIKLDATNNVGIYELNGSTFFSFAGTNRAEVRNNATGVYTSGGGSMGSGLSDGRTKNVISPYSYGLKEILQISPKLYTFKEGNPDNLDTKEVYLGFIAQEVQKVMPEAVGVRDDGYLRIDHYDYINWASINAIKELKTENDELKSELNDLKSRLEKLEKILAE